MCKPCKRSTTSRWRAANLEIVRESDRKYKQKYIRTPHGRALRRACEARRRALKRAAEAALCETEFAMVQAIFNDAAFLQDWLDTPMHVDHVVPLVRGGTHRPTNLRIVPAALNLRKGKKLDHELDADVRRHLPPPAFTEIGTHT